MRAIRSGRLLLVLCAGLLAAGCGSTSLLHAKHAAGTPSTSATAETVIRSWSNALRSGDVTAAAQYFALPSEFADGVDANGDMAVATIRTEAEAIEINASLSCGSVLISVQHDGRYDNALFRLTNRRGPGADCGAGVGELARTDFLIKGGRIVDWIRAPEVPGGSGTSTVPTPSTPQTEPVV